MRTLSTETRRRLGAACGALTLSGLCLAPSIAAAQNADTSAIPRPDEDPAAAPTAPAQDEAPMSTVGSGTATSSTTDPATAPAIVRAPAAPAAAAEPVLIPATDPNSVPLKLPIEVRLQEPTTRFWIEPWSDNDPAQPPPRLSFGKIGFRMNAEYRAMAAAITPLALNSDTDQKLSWFEHRLRVDNTVDYDDTVRLVTSFDALEGVLWGDNGVVGGNPASNYGLSANTLNVNATRLCTVNYDASRPADADAYRMGLCGADTIFLRRLYGEVMTPIGMFRIGRQPFTLGASVAVNDGDGRRNRFGVAYRGNTADRILFATKPLEAFKAPAMRDRSDSKGLFLILTYDKLVQDQPHKFRDDAQEVNTAVRWLSPKSGALRDTEARLTHTFRWDRLYDTYIHAFSGRFMTKFGDFQAGADGAVIAGETREVSEAFRLINNDPPSSQAIRQAGARAVVRYDKPKFTAYLEADFATGDSDPTPRSALTQYRFSEDSNVGLLMFKHIMAYQTARAASAATALFQNLDSPSIPVDAIATRGSFTNAVALFPQMDLRPLKNLLVRGGVLVAWAPSAVNDPVQSQQRRVGNNVKDSLVNFAGGAPDRFYGTELDARVQWRHNDHFALDLEGAILFPGSAFQDVDGYAVRSVLVQGRTTFFF